MKFLIDRCAGNRLNVWLISQGHDSIHIAAYGPDPGDKTILELAASEKRILITIDTDFGALVFRDSAIHSGIIRLPDVPSEKRIEIMIQLFAKHTMDLQNGAIITVRGNRIRITPQTSRT